MPELSRRGANLLRGDESASGAESSRSDASLSGPARGSAAGGPVRALPRPDSNAGAVVTALNRRKEFRASLCIVATALGADFATGRVTSAFYAQMGECAWAGIALSGAVFGAFVAMLAHLARRTGADGVPALLRRMPGGPMGRGAGAAYALIALASAGMHATAAGHAGALLLPMQHAGLWSAALALLAALSIALAGRRALSCAGAIFLILMGLFELALLFFAKPPEGAALRFELEFRLRNHLPAALGFALLHASFCGCVCAGAVVRLTGGRSRPLRMGLWSGGMFTLMLAGANAVLATRSAQLTALRLPFVALAGGWGSAGFYVSAALSYLAAATSLAGVAYALLPRKMMLNYENQSPQD